MGFANSITKRTMESKTGRFSSPACTAISFLTGLMTYHEHKTLKKKKNAFNNDKTWSLGMSSLGLILA
jgi:hypothetical protein